MHVNNIQLKSFRNYDYADINFCRGTNVIYGNNAQGKTNILESIYLFTTGKSYRTHKDREMIKFNYEYADIKMNFHNRNGENSGEIILSSDQKKRIKINEVPINKIGELMGFFNAVLFSPEDLNLVKEGPSLRRRFIDISISQLRPSYFYNLQQYIRILSHRNSLLKSLGSKKTLEDTLSVWDEELVKCGAKIILSRLTFIKKLREIVKRIHYDITQGEESLQIYYYTNTGIDEKVEDIQEIRQIFQKKLNSYKQREIDSGMTLIGPHRDDIYFLINNKHVRNYGSQGQQRTVVLSLKMAEMEFIKEDLGEYPVLLLDDIMSELDKNRQNYIMNHILNHQVIITCTDFNTIDRHNDINFYKVIKGQIEKA